MTGLGLEERELRLDHEFAARRLLLQSRGLSVPEGEGLVLGLYEGEKLLATGTLVGSVLQGIAVSDEMEGEGLASAIVTALIKRAVSAGLGRLFIFSSEKESARFSDMGFRLLAVTGRGGAALLEWGRPGIDEWLAALSGQAGERVEGSGAVVVNCNPFTKGHRALIEYAAARVPKLYVLVVEEDKSLFPFAARLQMVRRGTAGIPNAKVLAGGPYIISSATFPSYFVRPSGAENLETARVALHAALDLNVFRNYIAPALGIRVRFVGTEPYCQTTAAYNRIMKAVLQSETEGGYRLRVEEMPRLELRGQAVSASRVRDLIREGDLDAMRDLVPQTTWEWITSREAEPVLQAIRLSDSRH